MTTRREITCHEELKEALEVQGGDEDPQEAGPDGLGVQPPDCEARLEQRRVLAVGQPGRK